MRTLFFYAVTIPDRILYIYILYPLLLALIIMSVPAWSLYGFVFPPPISILIFIVDSNIGF